MNIKDINKDDIKGFECKHVMYSRSKANPTDDLLTIKENIHLKDGSVVPNLRMVKNYERNFYITKKAFQDHTDKKEWEEVRKLQKYSTTQAKMVSDLGRALGRPGFKGRLQQLANSPYVYGTDITTATLTKARYQKTFPDCISLNTVCVLDIETDMVLGHSKPIMIGITFRDKAFLGVTKEFIDGDTDYINKIHRKFTELLGQYESERGIKLECKIFDKPGEMCVETIMRLHEWQPDFVTAWNIDFDMPKITAVIEEENYNLAEVFSDPRVPDHFKHFKYIKGQEQKVKDNGDVSSIPIPERWHRVECPASFHFIDSMCVYKRIRMAEQNESSYSLDAQLSKHLNLGKLKFEEASGYVSGAWHTFMQKHYKVEYGIYNLFDCIGVELLDEKLKDLRQTISVQCGVSEYNIFHSQPKRLMDQLYFFCLEKKDLIVASRGMKVTEELDQYVTSKDDWIITLPSHLRTDSGLKIIKELPGQSTEIFSHVADADVASGYPNAERILNMSKETTFRELCKVKGVDETTKRMATINMVAGHVNATDVCCSLLNAPRMDELLTAFEADIARGNV